MSSLDWRTISSAVVGSSIAMAAIGYVLKTAIERSLDLRLDRIRDQHKAEIQEQFRRQALVWTSQYEAAKALLSLIYRFRNAFRDLTLLLNDESPEDRRTVADLFKRLETYGNGVVEILYEERAILPHPLFRAAHELKSPLMELTVLGQQHLSERKARLPPKEIARRTRELYQRIDTLYSMVVTIVHETAGIGEAGEDNADRPAGE